MTRYVVHTSTQAQIVLRPPLCPGSVSSVTISRTQIASVRRTLGIIHIETTGGHLYEVIEGTRHSQREKTAQALGLPGPTAHLDLSDETKALLKQRVAQARSEKLSGAPRKVK